MIYTIGDLHLSFKENKPMSVFGENWNGHEEKIKKDWLEKVKENGRAQTKPLDGVLIKIALENLRSVFPNKYVGIKQISNQKIIIINDFFKKDE